MTSNGKYIYGICDSSKGEEISREGIGGQGRQAYTLVFRDLSAILSDSPLLQYPLSRENLLAHQKVLESAMRRCTVLPVKFSTVADGEERIVEKVLQPRYEEFKGHLHYLQDKLELGLKALWKDLSSIYAEIVEKSPTLQAMCQQSQTPQNRMRLARAGERVRDLLIKKQEEEREELLKHLTDLLCRSRVNRSFGDSMVANLALLVSRKREPELDARIRDLAERWRDRYTFRYVGPAPPYNFIEIVIRWG